MGSDASVPCLLGLEAMICMLAQSAADGPQAHGAGISHVGQDQIKGPCRIVKGMQGSAQRESHRDQQAISISWLPAGRNLPKNHIRAGQGGC